jgi:hypothetical protein
MEMYFSAYLYQDAILDLPISGLKKNGDQVLKKNEIMFSTSCHQMKTLVE